MLYNCITESTARRGRRCARQAIRQIVAYESRYKRQYFSDNGDAEIKMQTRQYQLLLYRQYIFLSTSASITALKMISNTPDNQDVERTTLENKIVNDLTAFETYARTTVRQIKAELVNGNVFKARCKRLGVVTTEGSNYRLRVMLTRSQTSPCVMVLTNRHERNDNADKFCNWWHTWYSQPGVDLGTRKPAVSAKANRYWDTALLTPLFGTSGIISKIKQKARNHQIDSTITDLLRAEFEKAKYNVS